MWMGRFFKSSPNLEKSGDFAQNLAKNLDRLVYEWVTFSWKLGICMVYFQIPWLHIPTETKLEYPRGYFNFVSGYDLGVAMGQHPLRKKILRLVSWKCQISGPFLV